MSGIRDLYLAVAAGSLAAGIAGAGAAFAQVAAPPTSQPSASFDRLYVFGDSYSDGGAGYVDGNGPTAVVYLAHRIGLNLKPANVGGKEDSLNFAVSGASTGAGDGREFGRALLGRGMQNQTEDFAAKVRAGTIAFEPASTVFFIAGGLNDRTLGTERSIANLERLVARLYAAGGRRFVLARIPVGLMQTAVGLRLNPAIGELVGRLRRERPDASFAVSDWGVYFDRVRREGARFGFTDTVHACAARAIFGQDPVPCADPAKHFYYHDLHPSTRAHALVGTMLAREALTRWKPMHAAGAAR